MPVDPSKFKSPALAPAPPPMSAVDAAERLRPPRPALPPDHVMVSVSSMERTPDGQTRETLKLYGFQVIETQWDERGPTGTLGGFLIVPAHFERTAKGAKNFIGVQVQDDHPDPRLIAEKVVVPMLAYQPTSWAYPSYSPRGEHNTWCWPDEIHPIHRMLGRREMNGEIMIGSIDEVQEAIVAAQARQAGAEGKVH